MYLLVPKRLFTIIYGGNMISTAKWRMKACKNVFIYDGTFCQWELGFIWVIYDRSHKEGFVLIQVPIYLSERNKFCLYGIYYVWWGFMFIFDTICITAVRVFCKIFTYNKTVFVLYFYSS